MLLAVLSAILCIILPGKMMDIRKREVAGVYLDVPEEFYPTSSYYEVTKASSEKLSEYQKRQLISGQWESEISEVDKEYYEDSGYHIEKIAKTLLNNLEDKKLYPVNIQSEYSEWYNWKCTYMQALDTNFRSYAGFFWRVEFTHYEKEDKITVWRARKVQRFLAQPTFVAEKFTGLKGVYVPVKETVRGFKAIIEGEMDEYPEAAFYNVGTLDDAIAKAETLK